MQHGVEMLVHGNSSTADTSCQNTDCSSQRSLVISAIVISANVLMPVQGCIACWQASTERGQWFSSHGAV